MATRNLVIDVIGRVYPERDSKEILAMLDRYGDDPGHREKERVHLAILKLCDEEAREDPSVYVSAACEDYRDVLAWAEAPNIFKGVLVKDPQERSALIARDEAQYRAWLEQR